MVHSKLTAAKIVTYIRCQQRFPPHILKRYSSRRGMWYLTILGERCSRIVVELLHGKKLRMHVNMAGCLPDGLRNIILLISTFQPHSLPSARFSTREAVVGIMV